MDETCVTNHIRKKGTRSFDEDCDDSHSIVGMVVVYNYFLYCLYSNSEDSETQREKKNMFHNFKYLFYNIIDCKAKLGTTFRDIKSKLDVAKLK